MCAGVVGWQCEVCDKGVDVTVVYAGPVAACDGHPGRTLYGPSGPLTVLDKSSVRPPCQILPLPISRYRFKFQSNLVWDSIKSISNFCFQF
jgi:hypothetical protein